MKLSDALSKAKRFVSQNRGSVRRAAIVGSVLRRHEDVGDIDLLVIPEPTKRLPKQAGVNIFYTTPEHWEAGLLHYGPGMATVRLRAIAKSKGMILNQYGLHDRRTGQLRASSAKAICEQLGVEVPEPVVRSLAGDGVLER